MRHIDDLITKQKNGVILDEQQLACIETLDMILEEMEKYVPSTTA